MIETSITQNAPILATIDIAKARHEALIAIPGKNRRRRLTILSQLDDLKRLIASLARTRGALHNSRNKNDPKDAQVILHMMEIGNTLFYHDPLACGTNDIQELSKTHDIVSESKTEIWHRILPHYQLLYFP